MRKLQGSPEAIKKRLAAMDVKINVLVKPVKLFENMLSCEKPISKVLCREVQLDLTPEIEVFRMIFERWHTENRKRYINQHIKYFNFLN